MLNRDHQASTAETSSHTVDEASAPAAAAATSSPLPRSTEADLQSDAGEGSTSASKEQADEALTVDRTAAEAFAPNWAADAPRGGKVVLGRILKESAAVPLFLSQTFAQSLRDVGYDSTTSALNEHVDNAIGAGATEIRVFFRQNGRKGSSNIDVMVWDNGVGMAPNVLKAATSFGGSMSYGARSGIGRFGMGMKTAALSMSPVLEIFSWQEPGAFYQMILDVEAIGRDRSNMVVLPDPALHTELPNDVASMLTKPMGYPKDRESQDIAAPHGVALTDRLGRSGTIVYMPDCDRLSYARDRTLVDHATKEMSRVYRRQISEGLRLFVNNRRIEATDPTYAMASARHTKVEGLKTKTSRLIVSKRIDVPRTDGVRDTAAVTLRLFALPIEEWSVLPKRTLKNELQVYSGFNTSVLRNDREVFAGYLAGVTRRHGDANWFRLEVDFPGELDEAFGVAANKQGVRPKGYVVEAINAAIADDITSIRDEIKRYQAKSSVTRNGSSQSQAEARANDADARQPEQLDALNPEDEAAMEANLRGLAVTLRREDETEDDALDRIRSSRYLITYKHDQFWPFYHVEHKFGRVILIINTAHPFFTELYEPLMKPAENGDDEAEEGVAPRGPIVALELMLLSLARAQSVMGRDNPDAAKVFEAFRRSWSETYRIQLAS